MQHYTQLYTRLFFFFLKAFIYLLSHVQVMSKFLSKHMGSGSQTQGVGRGPYSSCQPRTKFQCNVSYSKWLYSRSLPGLGIHSSVMQCFSHKPEVWDSISRTRNKQQENHIWRWASTWRVTNGHAVLAGMWLHKTQPLLNSTLHGRFHPHSETPTV